VKRVRVRRVRIGLSRCSLFVRLIGLLSRPDYRAALASLSLGIIPGGSANGLAKSLLHYAAESYSAQNAAFVVARGVSRKCDVYTTTQSGKKVVGFLSLQWAIASDVDFESEQWRSCCGGARFTWTALVRMCCLRRYRARVEYLPAPGVTLHKPNWSTRK
jgi:sphingosine kinase